MDKATKTSIVKIKDGFQLLVDDQPFFIKGAGLEFGNVADAAAHGANSFRTWRVENGEKSGLEVLDEAHRHGMKVMMGIEVARERHGFDYDDKEAVKEQLEEIKGDVLKLKDHPALLLWGIGNELNLHASNPKVWDAVNDISKMIHEVDPNHLTTTSLAGFDEELSDEIVERAPDLDILSIQLYGAIEDLPGTLKEVSWQGPIIVSEWGATGYWEVKQTKWKAPIEDTSSRKAAFFLERYRKYIETLQPQCVGSYVFLWGQKQERTSTWFGLYTEAGRKTETVQVMNYIWKGQWPEEKCPKIKSFTLNGKEALNSIYLKRGELFETEVVLAEPLDISVWWEIMEESRATSSGGDQESIPKSILKTASLKASVTELKSPKVEGAYRLYVYVDGDDEYTAHANIPFYVKA
ncbi:MAG: hypothetical protein HRT61_21595 [Ekhidna sp.]|nr:hypothetical protein [Ekhidna sp.]